MKKGTRGKTAKGKGTRAHKAKEKEKEKEKAHKARAPKEETSRKRAKTAEPYDIRDLSVSMQDALDDVSISGDQGILEDEIHHKTLAGLLTRGLVAVTKGHRVKLTRYGKKSVERAA